MKVHAGLKVALVALVVIGYPVSMHLLLTSGNWPVTTLLMALSPFALLPLSLLATGRVLWAVTSLLALLAFSAGAWQQLLLRQELIYLLQNVGMQGLMAALFGHTLMGGQEPLVSQLARRIHREDYTAAIARYTRQVTWAWTVYFIAMGIASVLLFLTAPLTVWSYFVNFISFLALGLMFASEYAVRRWRLRDVQHVTLLRSIKLYWDKPAPADSKSGSL